MIKVINPTRPAKLFLRYRGKRLNFVYEVPKLLNVNLEYDKCFDFAKEAIVIKVYLIDGTDIYISILTRKVYKQDENKQWIQDEESCLMHHDIIVSKTIIYFTGIIINITNLNGEMIEDSYKFRLFIKEDCTRLFEYIDSHLEDLIIEDFR